MSPKRRYQSSSVGIGIPPPPLPPPEFYRPITPAEIAVNPVLTSRKIVLPQLPPTPDELVLEHSWTKDQVSQQQQRKANVQNNKSQQGGSGIKGDLTYRVRHYNPLKERVSLSQGIFGLPVVHDYFRHDEDLEDLGGTRIMDSSIESLVPPPPHPKEPKPRMKSTLPSAKPVLTAEEMDGIIQVRPASRASADQGYHHNYHNHHTSTSPTRGGSRGTPTVRRVQSTAGSSGSRCSPHPGDYQQQQHFQQDGGSSADFGSRLSQPPQRSLRKSTATEQPQLTPGMVETMLLECICNLKSTDWETVCEGFRTIVSLTEYAPFQVKSVVKKIIWAGLPHVASSRTKVSRAACQCFKRLFETQKRSMEGEGDKVFHRLLDLCGGPSNKFIQDECKGALLAAVRNTDALKCISQIESYGAKHRNVNVREFAAFLLNDIMERQSMDKVMKDASSKVIPLIVGFLREGQLNTRLYAKECLEKIFHHPMFDSKLRQYVSPENIRHVNDTLKKFRVRRVKSTSSTTPSYRIL